MASMASRRQAPKYDKIIGKWFRPGSSFVMRCCDCDLVHTVDFRLDEDGALEMRAVADNRETKRLRRENGVAVWRLS